MLGRLDHVEHLFRRMGNQHAPAYVHARLSLAAPLCHERTVEIAIGTLTGSRKPPLIHVNAAVAQTFITGEVLACRGCRVGKARRGARLPRTPWQGGGHEHLAKLNQRE